MSKWSENFSEFHLSKVFLSNCHERSLKTDLGEIAKKEIHVRDKQTKKLEFALCALGMPADERFQPEEINCVTNFYVTFTVAF